MLRRSLSRIAWSFGVRWGDPEVDTDRSSPTGVLHLVPVRASLRSDAGQFLAAGVFSAAALVVVFGASPVRLLPGFVAGVLAWGALQYLTDVRDKLPHANTLVPAPHDADVSAPGRRWLHPRLVVWFALCVALAWFASRWQMDGFFVPGQLVGYAAASLVGTIRVARWEREHGPQVLVRLQGVRDPELYTSH